MFGVEVLVLCWQVDTLVVVLCVVYLVCVVCGRRRKGVGRGTGGKEVLAVTQ